VSYRVTLDERAAHRATVEMTVTGAGGPVELWMPVWTPGAYELRTWGRNVTPLDASDGAGRALPFSRLGPSRFRVDPGPKGESGVVRLRYAVYAAKLTDDGSHIDAGHALLNGSSLFLAVRGQERGLHEVRVTLPPAWRAVTALDEDPGGGWRATSYEALIDAPIECGRFAEAHTRAAGRAYTIVVDGEPAAGTGGAGTDPRRANAAVPARFVEDVGRLAEAEAHLAGAPPYRRYVVLVHLADEIGRVAALEHAASTSILVPRRSFADPDAYDELTYVFAHELFHAWNARRLRPAELVPYDLSRAQPSRALWITEGLTEYFAHRAMLRAGRWSRADYLAHVGDEAERAVQAARRGSSVEEAAELTWQAPDDGEDDWDAYYARGHLVALALDATMRAQTGGKHGLDAVLRALLAEADRAGGALPVDGERLARAIDALAPGVGQKVLAWTRAGDETAQVAEAVAAVGLKLTATDAPGRTVAGFAADRDGAGLRVVAVADGGPAALAGLHPGDRVLQLDSAPPAARWAEAIGKKAPGAPLVLVVQRGTRTLELRVTLQAQRDVVCKLAPTAATPAITKLREAFLSP
jgi:predicted metalloprotease with PDZ domain